MTLAKDGVSDSDILIAFEAAGRNKTRAASGLGMARTTYRERLEKLMQDAGASEADPELEEKLTITESDEDVKLTYKSQGQITGEEVAKKAGFDLSVWKIASCTAKMYQTPMKIGAAEKIKHGKDGKSHRVRGEDRPIVVDMWYVEVKLERIVKKFIYEGIQLCCQDFLRKYRPKSTKPFRRVPVVDPHMLEVSVYDAHLSKLAWEPETGEDYDLDIAVERFLWSVEDLLNKSAGYNIEAIEFPIGNDFVHIDNRAGTTRKGTLLDFDSRYPKIVKTAQQAVIKAVDLARRVAPVRLTFVPGNHDETVSWHIMDFLSGWYRDVNDVEVDISTRSRKYIQYGCNLIGLTHGDKVKSSKLPLLMLTEARKQFDLSKIDFFEYHIGHWHTRKKVDYVAVDTFSEVAVRLLPSISGTDYWHYENGFVGSLRAAEAYLWSKEGGYTGHFSSNVRN